MDQPTKKVWAPTHGMRELDGDHADKLIARTHNGGWVWYDPKIHSIGPANQIDDDADNAGRNKGAEGREEEE